MDASFYGQLVVTGVTVGSIYAAAALGFVLIFRVTGILNFAQGEFLMVGAMVMVSLRNAHWPLVAAIPVTMALVFVLGCVIYALAIHPSIKRSTHVSLLLITLGVSQMLQGGAQLIWGENIRFAQPFSPQKEPFRFAGISITSQTIWIIGGVIVAVAAVWMLLERTGTGRALRACSSDPMMARLVGIDVRKIALVSFGASAGLAALAGLLLVPSIGVSYDSGSNLAIKGIAAAVLGGFGSLPGAVVGGIALGLLEAFGSDISSGFQTGIAMTVVIIVLLAFPNGLVGRRVARSPRGA